MSDEAKSLEVKITTPYNGSGAKAAKNDVDNLGGSTKEFGAKTGEATEKVAEQEKHLEGSRILFGEMNRIVPGLGHALHAAFSGPVGPAIALAMVVLEVKRSLDDANKAMDEAGEEASKGEFKSGIEALNTTLDTGRAALDAYAATIAKLAQDEITIAQALASQLELMKAIATAREAEAKAAEAAKNAETKRKVAAGEITPEKAVIDETADAVAAVKAEAARKKKETADEVAAKQAALDKANAAQPGLDADYQSKNKAYYHEKGHDDSVARYFTDADEQQRKAMAEADKLRAKIEGSDEYRDYVHAQSEYDKNPSAQNKANLEGTRASLSAPNVFGGGSLALDMQNLATLDARIHALSMAIEQYAKTQTPEHKSKVGDDKQAMEDADKKGKANQDEIDRLKNELADAQKNAAGMQPVVDKHMADNIAAILSQAVEKLYKEPHGAEVEAGVKVADQVESGKNVDGGQAQFLMALDAALGGHARNLKEAADHIEKFKDNAGEFFDAVITLTNAGFTAHQKQLDSLFTTVGRAQAAADHH